MLFALMVMPRSRSRSIESRTCSCILRSESAPVISSKRSASVDLPWSMCAMMQKFRMNFGSMYPDYRPVPFQLAALISAEPGLVSLAHYCHGLEPQLERDQLGDC